MRNSIDKTAKLLLSGGMGLILPMLVLGLFIITQAPTQAEVVADKTKPITTLEDIPVQQSSNLTITIKASTAIDPVNGSIVANGDFITYSLTVRNISLFPTTITLTNYLPIDTLEENSIECLFSPYLCQRLVETHTVPIPGSRPRETKTITITRQLQWVIPDLPSGESVIVQFKGRVICRQDGEMFQDFAVANGSITSNPVSTRVQADLINGQNLMSNGPTYCSSRADIFVDMNWGDYDLDGDLDVALVESDAGVVVYRNDLIGDERSFTRLDTPGYDQKNLTSVRWGDFNNDGLLDLVAVGHWNDEDSYGPTGLYDYTGYNYIFLNEGNGTFSIAPLQYNPANTADIDGVEHPYTFESNDEIYRTAVADYNNDGRVDVVLGRTGGGACGLQLNKQQSNGRFQDNLITTTVWATSTVESNKVKCLRETNNLPVGGLDWGDYNNDGRLDLAVGYYMSFWCPAVCYQEIVIYQQESEVAFTERITITDYITGIVGDVRWGDYDNDGYLDLAAAMGAEVYIYHNIGGDLIKTIVLPTDLIATRTLDWGDFDGDGQLELVVGATPIKIYEMDGAFKSLNTSNRIKAIRGVDFDKDGDLDISFVDENGEFFLFTNQNAGALFLPLITKGG